MDHQLPLQLRTKTMVSYHNFFTGENLDSFCKKINSKSNTMRGKKRITVLYAYLYQLPLTGEAVAPFELNNDHTDVIFAAPSHCQLGQHRCSLCCATTLAHNSLGLPPHPAMQASLYNLACEFVGDDIPQAITGQDEEFIIFSSLIHGDFWFGGYKWFEILITCIKMLKPCE